VKLKPPSDDCGLAFGWQGVRRIDFELLNYQMVLQSNKNKWWRWNLRSVRRLWFGFCLARRQTDSFELLNYQRFSNGTK